MSSVLASLIVAFMASGALVSVGGIATGAGVSTSMANIQLVGSQQVLGKKKPKKNKKTKSKASAKVRAAKAKAKARAARIKAAKKKAAKIKAAKAKARVSNKKVAVTPANSAKPSIPTEISKPEQKQPESNRNVLDDKAMWLWNWSDNDEVLAFARTHNVKEIFTYAHPGFSADSSLLAKLTDITQRGVSQDIRMWAMGGDPSWTTDHATAVNWVDEVVTSGLFDGIHLEIEPHSQAGYWAHQSERNRAFIDLLGAAKQAAAHHIVELSLPWWFHTIEYGDDSLDRAAISAVDQITIVTFNDAVAGIQMNLEHAQAIAQEQDKPYRLASETNSVEADWITFYGQGGKHMHATQNDIGRELQNDPLYLGFAVHDFTGWSALSQ